MIFQNVILIFYVINAFELRVIKKTIINWVLWYIIYGNNNGTMNIKTLYDYIGHWVFKLVSIFNFMSIKISMFYAMFEFHSICRFHSNLHIFFLMGVYCKKRTNTRKSRIDWDKIRRFSMYDLHTHFYNLLLKQKIKNEFPDHT